MERRSEEKQRIFVETKKGVKKRPDLHEEQEQKREMCVLECCVRETCQADNRRIINMYTRE